MVTRLPHIRRYVQNHVTNASPLAEFDGVVELTFARRDDLMAAFESPAGRALPGDERNFLGGKIVCDGETVVHVPASHVHGAQKVISLLLLPKSCDAEAVWRAWEPSIVNRAQSAALVQGFAVHRVRSAIRHGTEESGEDRVPALLIYHLTPSQAVGDDPDFRALVDIERAPQGIDARIRRFVVEPKVLVE